MNPAMIFQILELALGLAKKVTANTGASGDITTVASLEQIIATAVTAYEAEKGMPIDLSKLTYEPPIE